MVTSIFTSNYKVMAFMMFGLSIILSLCLILLVSPNILELEFWSSLESMLILLASILILVFGSLMVFGMKTIRVESNKLVFQNHLFANKVKDVQIKGYDFYKVVHEETENGFSEAVWLIKDGKLVDSFSTYQYSNYKELKAALNLKDKGVLDLSPFQQLMCRFGSKI